MSDSLILLNTTLRWLASNYHRFTFYCERDIVWTVQTELNRRVLRKKLPYVVWNDYPIIPGTRRSLSVDIAILNKQSQIELAIEFKYEPSHHRKDILKQKLPVVVWNRQGVGDDVRRVQHFLDEKRAILAISVFVDEGGYYRNKRPHHGTKWTIWPNGICVLSSMPSLFSLEPA